MSIQCRRLATLLLLSSAAQGQSTIDPAKAFAWSANAGWIHWRPGQPAPSGGAILGEAVCSGAVFAANFGWITLGDGTPDNGIAYGNNSASDFGVNVSQSGALSGYAYGANIGWINFEQTHGQPKVDLLTGAFSGFAWSANAGWINLGTGTLSSLTVELTDTDADGIGDGWERTHFGNLTQAGAATDFDHDGFTDPGEYAALTDPKSGVSKPTVTLAGAPQTAALSFSVSEGRLHTVQQSSNLQTWTTVPGVAPVWPAPGASSTTVALPFASITPPPRFFRILITKPLQP